MKRDKKYIHQDLFLATILFVIAIAFFIGTFSIPKGANAVSNIHVYPQLISGALIVFSLFNIYHGIKETKELNNKIAAGKDVVPEISMQKLKYPLIGIGIILLYTFGVAVIGFFVSTAVFLFTFIYYLGYRKIWITLFVIVGLEGFLYVLFVYILNTRLPAALLF